MRRLGILLLALAPVIGRCAGSSGSAPTRERLAGTTLIEGYPCCRYAHYHEDGSLKGSQLARAHTIAGHRFPEGTWFWLSPTGTLENCWLPKDREIAGVRCKGGGKISVGFHPDGTLASVFLTEDTEIQGVPCEASVMAPVRFHPDGKLRECRLAEDHVVDGERVPAGSTLRLDAGGRIERR